MSTFCFFFLVILPLIACPALHPVSVVSPLNVSQFTLDLAGHPDRQAVAYVLEGLQHGFRLGFQPAGRLQPAKKNKPSAFQNPKVIDDYLAIEVARGRVASPFPSPPLPDLQVSSFGVIPKKKVNPASGALLWTCHLPMGLVLTMVSIRTNFSCITFTWTRSLT